MAAINCSPITNGELPTNTLSAKLELAFGYRHVLRNVGRVQAMYEADAQMRDLEIVIKGGQSYEAGPFGMIVLSVSAPVEVDVLSAADTPVPIVVALPVKNVLLLDGGGSKFTIRNPDTQDVVVRIVSAQ